MSSPIQSQRTFDHRVAFLNSVFLFAGVVALGMGFYRWQTSVLLGTIDMLFAACNFSLIYSLKRDNRRVPVISTLALLLSYLLFTALYLLASYNSTRIALFLLLSASAFFLKGRQQGLVWLLVIIATVVAGYLLPGVDTGYSVLDIVAFCLYLIALYFVIRNYEIFNERRHEHDREREVLHRSEERFRTLVERGNDLILIVSDAGQLRFVSPSVESVLGFLPGDMIDQRLDHFVHPEDWERLSPVDLPPGAGHSKFELRMAHSDGGYRNIEMVGRNLTANCAIGGIVFNGRDITDRKISDDRLRLTAKVFANTLEGISITDLDGNIIDVNEAFCNISGYSREELIARIRASCSPANRARHFTRRCGNPS